jgi:8-oxo-dGTP pyrophosphatase MutT (NUDIX family)
MQMADTAPLPAASVLVLRDDPLEVLMLRRNETSSFAPNAWVFPGGITEQTDRDLARELGGEDSSLTAMRITAARETFEETGIWLGPSLQDAEQKRRRLLAGSLTFRHLAGESPIDLDRLVWTSRWITPLGLPRRFDTWFFLTAVGRELTATPEDNEAIEVGWIRPREALARHEERAMHMVFPTLRNLEAIAGFNSSNELIASRRGTTIQPIQPVLVDGEPTLPEDGSLQD